MVRRLIIINVAVFVCTLLVQLACNIAAFNTEGGNLMANDFYNLFSFPADWRELLWHPWTPITSMFLHTGLWHLIGNMIWLSLFGTVVGDLIGDRRVLPIYLLGGLAGGLLYFLSANLAPFAIGTHALGASAAVMAFGGTALILAPDYRVNLLLIGEVKLKYIVLLMILLDLVGASGLNNAGGHAAHIGGFIMGVIFVYALRDRRDLSEPVNKILDRLANFFSNIGKRLRGDYRPQMKVTHRRKETIPPQNRTGEAQSDLSHQERLDQILDKIKQQGLEKLSQEEKDFLFEASKK